MISNNGSELCIKFCGLLLTSDSGPGDAEEEAEPEGQFLWLAVSARRGGLRVDPECWQLPHKHQKVKGRVVLAYSSRKCDCERGLTREIYVLLLEMSVGTG